MSLLDDLLLIDQAAMHGLGGPDYHEAYERVRHASDLLDQPGARQWLEALPKLLELGRKATPGPITFESENVDALAGDASNITRVDLSNGFSSACTSWDNTEEDEERMLADAALFATLRNALADAEKGG